MHQVGGIEAGEVLAVLIDEVHHRERGFGRGGQGAREFVELWFRALAQSEFTQSRDPSWRLLVHRGEQMA